MSEEPRKRSRFDKEPEPEAAPRKSRFDRRSRSPAPPKDRDDRARTRSPVKSTESPGGDEAQDAAARAAAAVAARINASIQNKKAPQHVDVPPIRSVRGQQPFHNLSALCRHANASQSESAGPPPGSAGGVKSPTPSGTLNAEIYQQDGDFIKDIEVNDLRNRYTLTKGSTQKTVNPHFVIRCPLMHPGSIPSIAITQSTLPCLQILSSQTNRMGLLYKTLREMFGLHLVLPSRDWRPRFA